MTSFKILSDAEHLRLRPAMYIGSTSLEEVSGIIDGKYQTLNVVPGLLKIINEIIDNSVDEFVRTNGEFANKISVSIKSEGRSVAGYGLYRISTSDNGRGIPAVKHGVTDDTYQAVLAWTKARAGSNFGEDRVTLGANGVGSFCTNVFSEEFKGVSSDGVNRVELVCVNGSQIKSVKVKPDTNKGTSVEFVPDLSLFGVDEISDDHITFIRDRLENLMVCYPGLTFKFNGETLKYRSAKQFAARFGEHTVLQQDENNIIVFAPSGSDEEFRVLTYVNGLWIKNGGSHIDSIVEKIVAPLRDFVKKKHKIDVLPNHIRSHLTVAVYSRNFKNLKFDSQTKERITNTRAEVDDQYKSIDFNKLAKQILNTPEIIDPMIQALLFKKEQADRLALARAQKKNQKVRVVNHIAAQSKDPNERSLFIAEGLSAIGQLINVRDARYVGGYPLKGKVMNVRGMKPVEIVKNKEISELMSILNLELGQKPLDLAYSKIIMLTDADTDGASIACLLVNLFSNWPELFKNGNIYRCETPLYIAKKGKITKWFYTQAEFDLFDSKGYDVDYCKGLGTLSKEVYKEVINNPKLIQITAEDIKDFEYLEMAFGADSDKRKEWLTN